MRLEAGDFHGFHEDITTVHRLARLLASAATMVDRLVAVELQTSASRTERLAASGGELSREQMKALLDDLAKMPELPPFDDAVNCGERFMVLDILQSAARPARRHGRHQSKARRTVHMEIGLPILACPV
jgi:hypothetical protein